MKININYIERTSDISSLYPYLPNILYNKLNNVVLEFAITGEKFSRTYQLILFNETKITIKENGFMNVKYKIEN